MHGGIEEDRWNNKSDILLFSSARNGWLAQITSRLYDHVWEQWCTDTRSLLETLPGALASGGITPQAVGQALERWLLLLKVNHWRCSNRLVKAFAPCVVERSGGRIGSFFGFQSRSLFVDEHTYE